MPQHLLDTGLADWVLKPAEMPEMLERYGQHPYATGRGLGDPGRANERSALNEILSLMRNRVRHDFTGYKKPTLMRRVERRMGLQQIVNLPDYARYLRQNPAETSALADDLMIHVTGFFRDPEAWAALEKRAIRPLIQARDGGAIRAWVTACSSGEEAYTLAMLLTEAAQASSGAYDIKIFATDTAERSLSHARAGLYSAAIESEISAERLERFFEREQSMYRVKNELREMVVFAPQNILQDPPFSRLDICTCRNLLIYLEPHIQHRALELMHFGLREGGTLFLGNSETIAGDEQLYEALDKKHRIYRRIGPTRHGAVEFPLLKSSSGNGSETPSRARTRPSVAMMTNKALLDRYSPPSVVIDRDLRILYFHGLTERYLDQPRGEPTRDILTLARETVRSAVRTAIHQSITQSELVRISAGATRAPDGRRFSTTVSVSPLEKRDDEQLFLVSFDETLEVSRVPETPAEQNADDYRELAVELHRVREELENTIQELHSSNEDLKAAHEEATSVNEEMQSTNEELETSKEELQSLNEELITVNTQLQLKMEELEGTTNDLSSLLSSTTIAVVFLDTNFRIRRFTPAVSDLIDLLHSDIGRPVSDLARKFSDDALLHDARLVLEKLAPLEREVASESGRQYVRRILPYRTADNRIDGVVITFVDISARVSAEAALRESEEQHRLILEGLSDYGIFMLSPNGKVITWTRGAERVFGYTATEAIGMNFPTFLGADEAATERAQNELNVAAAEGNFAEDGWHVRKGGSQFWGSGMMGAIRDRTGGLRGFVKVLRDNTDRKLGEEALRQAKNAADAANQAKDNFLANVSHELRTPLSAILLWSHLLRDQANTPPEQLAHALQSISRSAEEQMLLIEDLVDTSRIAAGKLVLEKKPTDLGAVVRTGVESLRSYVEQKQLSLNVDISSEPGLVEVDPMRLQQVVSNLVGNAIKFTNKGGHVWVVLRRNNDEVTFTVQDDGIGISSEFLPQVFERFSQSRAGHSRGNDGMGLGLAIVHYIVELHGGSVKVESAGVGGGTTFTVRMRLPILRGDSGKVIARTENRTLSRQLDGMRILLIEDVDETRLALEATLHETGAQTIACENATRAIEEFERLRPDIVLSDLGLPDVDGFELIGRLRAFETSMKGRSTPAIALTAFAGQNIRRKAIDSGFQLCLTKPIEPFTLLDAIRELVPVASGAQTESS